MINRLNWNNTEKKPCDAADTIKKKKFTAAFVTIIFFDLFVKIFASLSKRPIVKHEVAWGFPDEMLDRPQIKIRIKDLVVAEKLDAFLGKGGAVFGLAAAAVVVVAAAAPRTRSRVMMVLASGTSGVRARFWCPHHLLVHMLYYFPESVFEICSKYDATE